MHRTRHHTVKKIGKSRNQKKKRGDKEHLIGAGSGFDHVYLKNDEEAAGETKGSDHVRKKLDSFHALNDTLPLASIQGLC